MNEKVWERAYARGIDWNSRVPPAASLQSLLDAASARWPEKTAFEFYGHCVSFPQWQRLSARVAKGLQDLGVGPGTNVGLHLGNSPHFLACFFGILYAGGRVVSLGAGGAPRELAEQLENSEASILITSAATSNLPNVEAFLARNSGHRAVCCHIVDSIDSRHAVELWGEVAQVLPAQAMWFADLIANDGVFRAYPIGSPANELALLQYTGGTTGVIKAAMLTHSNLWHAALIAGSCDSHLIAQDKEVRLAILPLHHIFGVHFLTLACVSQGYSLVLHARFDAELALTDIQEKRVTCFAGVPAMLEAIATEQDRRKADVSSLQRVTAGGAPLSEAVLRHFESAMNVMPSEGYGASETCAFTTTQRLVRKLRAGSVGVPWPQINVEILDPQDETTPVAQGAIGEICTSGPTIMLGYWKSPIETDLVIKDGRFHTGDIGFFDDDGYLVVAGRKKDMIISGGYKIFPRVVEDELARHPSINEVAVIGVPDALRGQVVKAFVAFRKNASPVSLKELRRFLSPSLAMHELPSILEVRVALPKTTANKIAKTVLESEVGAMAQTARLSVVSDIALLPVEREPGEWRLSALVAPRVNSSVDIGELRRSLEQELPEHLWPVDVHVFDQLPRGEHGRLDPDHPSLRELRGERNDHATPTSEVEGALSKIWCEILGLRAVRLDDSFFDIGGHSLLATRLVSRVRQELGCDVSLRELFERQSIRELAAFIEWQRDAQKMHSERLPLIVPDLKDRHKPFPLTEIQEAYWLGRQRGFVLGNVAAYGYFEFMGRDLDPNRLSAAWQRLIHRHDMLRAVVLPEGDQQILDSVPEYVVAVHDLRRLSERAVAERLADIRERLSQQVLPTHAWPLFSIEVSQWPDGSVCLHVGIDLLIADLWSLRILFGELRSLYENPDTQYFPLAVSFRDYVLAEKRLQQTPEFQASLNYWVKRLADLPGGPELALACEPATIERPVFRQQRSGLVADLWQQVERRARQEQLTPTTVLLTVYAAVLEHFSGSRSFTLNLTLFNRLALHPQVDEIVGDFTSLLPLVVDYDSGASFLSQAKRVQEQLWSDLEHRSVSGTRIMRERARSQGGSLAGSFPVVFTSALGLEDSGGSTSVFDNTATAFRSGQTPQVWLDLNASEVKGALYHAWSYVEGLFPEGLIEAMFRAFCDHLELLACDAQSWERALPSFVPAAQMEQRREVNQTQREFADVRLEELFIATASARGEATAVISSRRTLSYQELERYSLALALRIGELGSRSAMIGVVMEKGWEQIAAVLGVLRAGAAYVPIDPNLPAERVTTLLRHGEIEVVLTQSWIDERVSWPSECRRIIVDHEAAAPADQTAREVKRDTQALAYVIYTSGSTGMPKGVMISHRGAVNTVLDVNERCSLRERDRILSVSSLSFDLSVYDIFGALAAGGAIVLPDASAHPDPAHWAQMLLRHEVTVWNSVPALLQLALEEPLLSAQALPALRVAMLSGDWIPVSLPDRLWRVARQCRVLAMGGATEASIWSNYKWVDRVDPSWSSIPYGRPLSNQRFHVLNERLQPCPVWTAGELYIAGMGLAQGYWRDPQRTAESFITHPQSGEALYRTGDIGRYLPDGEIEFLGRRDTQVKISGHRIELGEIESALSQHPQVHSCVVDAFKTGTAAHQKALAAYVVPMSGATLTLESLRQYLSEKLPAYMVPKHCMFLESLPLTGNGKVNRKALPIPDMSVASEHSYVAPRTQTETLLATVWEEILKVQRVGVNDNFFDLGGDSLSASRLIARLNTKMDSALEVRTVFQCPTLGELAEVLASQLRRHTEVSAMVDDIGMQWRGTVPQLQGAQERDVFKVGHHGIRKFDHSQRLSLITSTREDSVPTRRSARQFNPGTVSMQQVSDWLFALKMHGDGKAVKFGYASAGGLYPVQAYLHARAGERHGIVGLSEGGYYYDPREHSLVSVSPGRKQARAMHALINRPVFDQASATLFLIADMRAIVPIYGEQAFRMSCIEAGLMAQVLETRATELGLATCHVGQPITADYRQDFDLAEHHVLLHMMFVGKAVQTVSKQLASSVSSPDQALEHMTF